ncbi:MAG: phage/plasmid primase, P4 family [Pirellulales bacterium]
MFTLPFEITANLQEAIEDVRELLGMQIVFKTEGATDLFALKSCQAALGKFVSFDHSCWTNKHGCGESPIGNDSRGKPRQWLLDRHRDQVVFVVHDLDQPGQQGALEVPTHGGKTRPGWATALASTAQEVRNIVLPGEIAETKGADLEDFLAWLCEQIMATGGFTIDDRDVYRGIAYCLLLKYCQFQPVIERQDITTVDNEADSESMEESEVITQSNDIVESESIDLKESVDDPYRLARINLTNYQAETGKQLRYWRQTWFSWHNGRYKKKDTDDVLTKVRNSIRAEFERRCNEETRRWMSDPKQDEKPQPEVRKISQTLVSNVISTMSSLQNISASVEMQSWIPDRRKRNLISLKNGLLNLDRFLELPQPETVDDLLSMAKEVLEPHSPDWFSTVYLDYNFIPNALAPEWESAIQTLMQGDSERISILQEWAGYQLVSHNKAQKFLAIEGEGGNGKSVYIKGLQSIIGEANYSSVPLEIFSQRFALTETLGKMANFVGDVGELDSVNEGLLKQFTGGDSMFFDRKGKEGLQAIPTAKLTIAWNNRPRIKDRSNGAWRRLLLVPFNYEIPASERKLELTEDGYWMRSGEIEGIFMWALAGLHRLHRNGYKFNESKICNMATAEYRSESNPEVLFMDDYMVPDDGVRFTRSSEIYSLYEHWCSKFGITPVGSRKFFKEFKKKFPSAERKRRKGDHGYIGARFAFDEIEGRPIEQALLVDDSGF